MNKFNLKTWIITLIIAALLVAVGIFAYQNFKGIMGMNNNASTPRGADGTDKLTAEQKKDCNEYTPQVTSGPYYYSNTPKLILNDLNYTGSFGKQVKINGYVYGSKDGTVPLANAKIELWQTDDLGKYYPQSSGDYEKTDKKDFSLRGYIETDDKGYYEYTSILPGEYEGRPRHSHYKISKDGYGSIITQLTFSVEGDKNNADNDNIAQSLLSCQNFKNLVANEGKYTASYTFRLKKN
jgi:protocatechuate 3,4-dioxygenase beta subunit